MWSIRLPRIQDDTLNRVLVLQQHHELALEGQRHVEKSMRDRPCCFRNIALRVFYGIENIIRSESQSQRGVGLLRRLQKVERDGDRTARPSR